jgi:hypothetical protein
VLAVLYRPVWTSAITLPTGLRPRSVGLFILGNLPQWIVVTLTTVGGARDLRSGM